MRNGALFAPLHWLRHVLHPPRSTCAPQYRGVAIPWFTAESWPNLLEVAADRANLPRTFAEFERRTGERVARRVAKGVPLKRVVVDVTNLVAWCHWQGIPIDGRARASFAAYLLEYGPEMKLD